MDIEVSKPKIFLPLDLSDLAWQMNLSQEQAVQTAFTIPGDGQFQWKWTPLGLLDAQASFHRLLSAILHDISGVLVHIDWVIVYYQQWDNHLQTLNKVLKALKDNGLRLNLHWSQVGTDSANIMGFQITQGHFHMAPTQLGAAKQWEPPTDTKMTCSILGLCNFFIATSTTMPTSRLHSIACFKKIRSAMGVNYRPKPWKRSSYLGPALPSQEECLDCQCLQGSPRLCRWLGQHPQPDHYQR